MTSISSTLHYFPNALLAATLTLACTPKDSGGDTDGSGDTSSDTSDGTSGDTSSSGTTVTQECMPGDSKPTPSGGCFCECSDQGMWLCERCAPTTSESATDATATDATATDGTATDGTATDGTATDGTATDATTATTTTGDTTDSGDTTDGGGFLPACDELGPSDPFDVIVVKIVGDEMEIDVEYSGGCEDHEFTLCFDSFDADNGINNLAIHHENNGDACEAWIMETRKFDLTPLQQAGPSPSKFILLGIGAFTYEF